MKLDVNALRYLTKDDFRVLQAVELGQRNVSVHRAYKMFRLAVLFLGVLLELGLALSLSIRASVPFSCSTKSSPFRWWIASPASSKLVHFYERLNRES